MSAEPNKPIEDQLRAFAESRRLACPPVFELDAPARQRLQDEVRRVYRAEPASVTSRLSMWIWTRVALAGATAALVLFLGVQLLPKDQPVLLSQQTERPPEAAAREFAERSRQVSSPDSRAPLTRSRRTTLEPTPSIAPSATAIAPMAAEPSGAVSADREENFETRDTQKPIPISVPTAENTAALAATDGVEPVGAVNRGEQYRQVPRYRRNPNSPPPPQVLQSFRWVSEGDAIRVIDADGSIYSGALAADPVSRGPPRDRFAVVTARGVRGDLNTNQVVLRQAGSDAVAAGSRFVVVGTNRTMNVRVVFEGVLLPQVALQRSAASASGAGQALNADAAQIRGQAVVGTSTRLEIVAERQIE